MRKPGTAKPLRLPTKMPAPTPLPIAEIVTSVDGMVSSVANAYAEHQRTKQVVAQADRDKTIAVEETRRILGEIDFRREELLRHNERYALDHEHRMAELQLRADDSAFAREARRRRVENVIEEACDFLPLPQGRLLK